MENKSKNKILLKKEQIDFLDNLPESGMGYQLVNITLKNGRIIEKRVVLNSQYLLLNEDEKIIPEAIDKIELVKE